MLDIVNHLLDFLKINIFTKTQHRGDIEDDRRDQLVNIADNSSTVGSEMTLNADVSLDVVTEEIVQTVFYSFCWSKDPKVILEGNVGLVLDIDRSVELDWRCRIPTGAWKRICMNLIGNAFEIHNRRPHSRVAKVRRTPSQEKGSALSFQSQTPGRGMSQDFLANYLFKAFSQEDDLIEGTGLGMSFVAKIVKALGGKVDVQSEERHWDHALQSRFLWSVVPLRPILSQRSALNLLGGVSIIIFAPHDDDDHQRASDQEPVQHRGKALILSSLRATCSNLGIRIQDTDLADR